MYGVLCCRLDALQGSLTRIQGKYQDNPLPETLSRVEAYAGEHDHLVDLMDEVSYAVAAGALKLGLEGKTISASTLQDQLVKASEAYHAAVYHTKDVQGRLEGALLWETRRLPLDHCLCCIHCFHTRTAGMPPLPTTMNKIKALER
jgi:hypothetical protein